MTTAPLRHLIFLALAGVLLVMVSACGDSTEPGAPGDGDSSGDVELIQSELSRNTAPDATPAEIDDLVAGNHAFALDLYEALLSQDPDADNLLTSPVSIRIAFAMVYAGARGATADEMADTLHYDLGDERLHNAFNALDLALADRNVPAGPDEELDAVELYVANAFWGQTGYPFLDDYLDVLAVNYGAGVHALDFATAPEASRVTINDWVEERTRDRIQDLLPPSSISSSTVAVLTNALYLKAPWAAPFDEAMTRDATFTLLDGAGISVPTMYEVESHGYTEGPGYQALEMTYRTDELSMVFLLPDAGTFADFEAGLDADTLAGILDDLETRSVEVTLPRFEFESSFTLKETLQAMGMVIPFTGSADLSGMVEGGGLFIDNAYHKTFIAVDEEGTEAAAATAVVIVETSAPAGEVEFHADRPFLFLIRDRVTGALLFFGRMVDPS